MVSGQRRNSKRASRCEVRGVSIPQVATRFLIPFRAERGLMQLQILDCL
jgi:hypothetical protein